MKTIIQIAVAAILLTASVQGGRAAFKHYQFVDAIQEAMLFAGSRTEDQIADRVIQLAGDYQIPLEPGNVSVQRAPYQIIIDAPYTDTVNVLPGFYSRSWDFETKVNVRLLEDTRPRGTAPQRQEPEPALAPTRRSHPRGCASRPRVQQPGSIRGVARQP